MGTAGSTARGVAFVEENAKAAVEPGYRAPGARTLQSMQEAVQNPDIDLIDIFLPDSLHHAVAKTALLAGKHV